MIRLFLRLPFAYQAFVGMALCFVGMMIWDQSFWWRLKPDYIFGFLVPFLVGYVLYAERGNSIRERLFDEKTEEPKEGSSTWKTCLLEIMAYGALLISFVFLSLGFIMRAAQGTGPQATVMITFGVSIFLLCGIFVVFDSSANGRKWSLQERISFCLLFLFPALIWLLSAPMLPEVEKRISVFLLNKVAAITFFVFDTLGLQIQQEGNVLILPSGSVGVEDACSGIRSLTACLFAGSFLAAVYLKEWWKKILLVVVAMMLAVITNLFRSFFLTGWAYRNGAESIEGLVHDLAGYGVLFITCILLIALLPLFNLNKEKDKSYYIGIE